MGLQLVHSRRVACWPWPMRDMQPERPIGAVCRDCGRDVALPITERECVPVCIYCAMDAGLIEAVDTPLGEPVAYADGRALMGKEGGDG